MFDGVINGARDIDENEQGFSVLEAMVAVALLAVAFIPLLQLQSQFVRSVDSFERAHIRNAAHQDAVNYLKTVNFAVQPAGQQELGEVKLIWTSRVKAESRKSRILAGQFTRFDVSLYGVTIRLTEGPSGRYIDDFTLTGFGWKPDTSFESTLF